MTVSYSRGAAFSAARADALLNSLYDPLFVSCHHSSSCMHPHMLLPQDCANMKLSGFLLFLLACPSFVYGRDVPDHNRSPHNPPSPTTPAPSAFVQAPMTPTQTPVKPANPRRSPLATPVCSAPVPISLPSCGATVRLYNVADSVCQRKTGIIF